MPRRALVLSAITSAFVLGSPAAPSFALSQLVSGTALSTLSLTAGTPAVFGTSLAAGTTVGSTGGTLTGVSTSPSWSLAVRDQAAGTPGHLVAAASGCSGSTPALTNAAKVTVTPVVANGAITSAGQKAITGSDVTVASASNALLASTVFTTAYQQVIDSDEVLTAGCVYSMTTTYTLQ